MKDESLSAPNRLVSGIVADIKSQSIDIKSIFVFGSAQHSDYPGDLDLLIIIPDNMSIIETTRALSPILARLTAQSGILVSCFPINASRFRNDQSQFIKNIRENGHKL